MGEVRLRQLFSSTFGVAAGRKLLGRKGFYGEGSVSFLGVLVRVGEVRRRGSGAGKSSGRRKCGWLGKCGWVGGAERGTAKDAKGARGFRIFVWGWLLVTRLVIDVGAGLCFAKPGHPVAKPSHSTDRAPKVLGGWEPLI